MGRVFELWDYLVVGLMLLASGAVGVFFRLSGGRQRTPAEYLMAGRDMGLLPVSLSLAATVQTAVGTLGFPGEVYLYGAGLFAYPLGFALALLLCAFLHTPVYFGMRLTSAYEYLERRFGKLTRSIISVLFVLQMILFMSVGLYSPSIALSAVSGLSHFVSILTVGLVCAFYCTLGGMKAVLWTDVFQSVLMFLALLSVIVKGSADLGGVAEVLRIAQKGGRLNFFDLSFDPTLRFTLMSTFIGGFMYGVTTCGANQTQVQRLLTVRTLKRSQLALLISIPMNLLMYYTIYSCGLVIYAHFAGCDPLLSPHTSGISSGDQLIPYFMIRSFSQYPGMAGFCVSGVFCAALTSISSAVNSLAAVTVEDFVRPLCSQRPWFSERSVASMSKLFAFLYSALCIGMTYLVGNIRAIIPAAFVVFTAIGGPTLSIITLGMLTTTSNQKGILVGLLSGIALNAWIGTGAIISDFPQIRLPQSNDSCPVTSSHGNLTATPLPPGLDPTTPFAPGGSPFPEDDISLLKEDIFPLYKLSFLLHPVPGTLLTFIIGYVVSFITGGDSDVDEELLCTFMRKRLRANTRRADVKVVPNFSTSEENPPPDLRNGFAGHVEPDKLKNGFLEESKL